MEVAGGWVKAILGPFPWGQRGSAHSQGLAPDSCQPWGQEVLGVSQGESTRTWPPLPGKPSQAPHQLIPGAAGKALLLPLEIPPGSHPAGHSPPAAGNGTRGSPSWGGMGKPAGHRPGQAQHRGTATVWSRFGWLPGGVRKESSGKAAPPPTGLLRAPGHRAAPKGASVPPLPGHLSPKEGARGWGEQLRPHCRPRAAAGPESHTIRKEVSTAQSSQSTKKTQNQGQGAAPGPPNPHRAFHDGSMYSESSTEEKANRKP